MSKQGVELFVISICFMRIKSGMGGCIQKRHDPGVQKLKFEEHGMYPLVICQKIFFSQAVN